MILLIYCQIYNFAYLIERIFICCPFTLKKYFIEMTSIPFLQIVM